MNKRKKKVVARKRIKPLKIRKDNTKIIFKDEITDS